MLNGDLANHISTTFAFRCDGFLVKYKEGGVKNAILNTLVGKVKRAEIDHKVLGVMGYIYRNTEYTVDLVVKSEEYTDSMKEVLEDVPFNRVILIDNEAQITSRLLAGDISYYVDDDLDRLSLTNSPHAITLDAASKYARSGSVR